MSTVEDTVGMGRGTVENQLAILIVSIYRYAIERKAFGTQIANHQVGDGAYSSDMRVDKDVSKRLQYVHSFKFYFADKKV